MTTLQRELHGFNRPNMQTASFALMKAARLASSEVGFKAWHTSWACENYSLM